MTLSTGYVQTGHKILKMSSLEIQVHLIFSIVCHHFCLPCQFHPVVCDVQGYQQLGIVNVYVYVCVCVYIFMY
jgi:hypothetical protein